MFDAFFQNIKTPILLCQEPDMQVVYGNQSAIDLLRSKEMAKAEDGGDKNISGKRLFQIAGQDINAFMEELGNKEEIVGFETKLHLSCGESIPVTLSANWIHVGEKRYLKFCIDPDRMEQMPERPSEVMMEAFQVVYKQESSQASIEKLLDFLGNYFHLEHIVVRGTKEGNMSSPYDTWWAPSVSSMEETLAGLWDERDCIVPLEKEIMFGQELDETTIRQLKLDGRQLQSFVAMLILSQGEIVGHLSLYGRNKPGLSWSQVEQKLLRNFADMLGALIRRRSVERSLQYSLEILNTVTDNFENIALVTDIQTSEILFANNGFSAAVNIPVEQLYGKNSTTLLRNLGRKQEEDPLGIMLDKSGNVRGKYHTWEFKNTRNGKWYLVRNAIIQWIDGRDVHIETATEITYQKEHEAELEYVASRDMMTGMYNREWGRRLIERLLDPNRRGRKASLVFLDIDGLKKVNDQFGHVAGDHLILNTVSLIKSCIRQSDIMIRWGGDEFVLVLRANEEEAGIVLEKIKRRVEEFNRRKKSLYKIGFSHGIVEIGEESALTVNKLIAIADERMYAEKAKLRYS